MSCGTIYKRGDNEYWYDRHYRCWYAMKVDTEGNQVGESVNAYTKKEIIDLIDRGFTGQEYAGVAAGK